MEGWVLAGLIVGIIVGFISGAAVTFAYITYRSYTSFLEFQEEMLKSEKAAPAQYDGGMSA